MINFAPDSKDQKAFTEFKNGNAPDKMIFINGRDDKNKPFRMIAELEALGDILQSEYGHSILVRFTDPEDQDQFDLIEQEARNLIPEGIDYKDMIRDGKFFLKLQTKDGRYKAQFNPSVTPANPEKAGVHQGSLLDIEFQPNVWINFENTAGGLYLNTTSITVDGGKKKSTPRKR
jgi:hypothetical protein